MKINTAGKLLELQRRLTSKNSKIEDDFTIHSVVDLTARLLVGGIAPSDDSCSNSGCHNTSCATNSDGSNGSCNNSLCTGTNNNGCLNSGCKA